MSNQPAANTVSMSFTLPRDLAIVVDRMAKRQMTNKSDIIRRALLAYIPKEDADQLFAAIERTDSEDPMKSVRRN